MSWDTLVKKFPVNKPPLPKEPILDQSSATPLPSNTTLTPQNSSLGQGPPIIQQLPIEQSSAAPEIPLGEEQPKETNNIPAFPHVQDTGETFNTYKPQSLGGKVVKGIAELSGVPFAVRKVQGLTHAFKENDPALARQEFEDIGLYAASNLALGLLGKVASPVLQPVGRFIGENIMPVKDALVESLGPLGAQVDKYVWNPIRQLAKRIPIRSNKEVDDLSQLANKDFQNYLKQSYASIKDPNVKKELMPLFKTASERYHLTTGDIANYKFTPLPEDAPPEAKLFNLGSQSVLNSFNNTLNIKGSTGLASPNEAFQVLTDKINSTRLITASVEKMFQPLDKLAKDLNDPDLLNKVWLATETPEKIAGLPDAAKYYPAILRNVFNSGYQSIKDAGYEINFWDNYLPHITRTTWENLSPEVRGARTRLLSEFVSHIEHRNLDVPLTTLKGIAEGTIISPKQIPGYTGSAKSFEGVRDFLFGNRVVDNPREAMTGYFHAFARSEMTRSTSEILKEVRPYKDFPFLRGALSQKEYDSINTLVKNTNDTLIKNGKPELAKEFFKVKKLLNNYVSGDKIGLPANNMYHPDIAKKFAPILRPAFQGSWYKGMQNLLASLKVLKLSGSFFHAFSQNSVVTASGEGLDALFIPKTLKYMATAEGQKELAYRQAMGLDSFQTNKLIQEAFEMIDQNGDAKAALPAFTHWMQKNWGAKLIFDYQGKADQWVIMDHHIAKIMDSIARGTLPAMSKDDIYRTSAALANLKMSSLRPEIMNNIAREAGNNFLLARNWGFAQFYSLLNAMNEWFIKTPSAMGFLPKEIGELFSNTLNGIQNYSALPQASQQIIHREMADFFGVSIALKQLQLQFMNYMLSGHSTYDNAPGHELDIDSGMVELKKSPSGRMIPHHVYYNGLGIMRDAFEYDTPFHIPLPEYVHTKDAKVWLQPLNYVDPNKLTKTAINKSNILFSTLFNISRGSLPGETRLEAAGRIAGKATGMLLPIPIETVLPQLLKTHDPESALMLIFAATLGYPSLKVGESQQTQKARNKNLRLTPYQQFKRGLGNQFQ